LGFRQRIPQPVVDNQELGLGQDLKELRRGAVGPSVGDFLEELGDLKIADRNAVAAGGLTQGAGQVGLARARRAGDDDVKMPPDPVFLGEGQNLGTVETAGNGEVEILDDRGLVERAEAGRGLPAEAVGLDTEPLWIRLYIARKEKKLSQAEVGRIFGVSQGTANYWERGTDPGEDGKVHGKAIPADVAPLILRWVETGEAPKAEELAAIKAGRKKKPKKKNGPRLL
jgi:DNA-binding XRE family transcriptional regulator